jgi:hypothetical protein
MLRRKSEEMKMHIEKGRVVSWGRGEYVVNCIRGSLWITWPGSGDIILRDGDELAVRQQGKLCVTSLNNAFVQIQRKAILPCLKDLPRIAAEKLFKSILNYAKDGENNSAFGESVHSIIR